MNAPHAPANLTYRLAPWVYGATYVKDYDPIAVGRDLANQTALISPFAQDAIEGLGIPRSHHDRTWAVIRRDGLVVMGMACAGELAVGKPVNDAPQQGSRPIYYFLGYAWRGTGTAPYVPMDDRLFAVLFRAYVEPNFMADFQGVLPIDHDIRFSVTIKGRDRFLYTVACPDWEDLGVPRGAVEVEGPGPNLRHDVGMLSTTKGVTTVFPATSTWGPAGRDLWDQALLGQNHPLSLCAGYLSEHRKGRTPYLNITLPSCTSRYQTAKKTEGWPRQQTLGTVGSPSTRRPSAYEPSPAGRPKPRDLGYTSRSHPIQPEDVRPSRAQYDEERYRQDLIGRIIAVLNCLSLGTLERVLAKLQRYQRRIEQYQEVEVLPREPDEIRGGSSTAREIRERLARGEEERSSGSSFAILSGEREAPELKTNPGPILSLDPVAGPETPIPPVSDLNRPNANDEKLEEKMRRNLSDAD
jgi:hypothetical protein